MRPPSDNVDCQYVEVTMELECLVDGKQGDISSLRHNDIHLVVARLS